MLSSSIIARLMDDINSHKVCRIRSDSMKSCPGGKEDVFPEGGLEFEPNCA